MGSKYKGERYRILRFYFEDRPPTKIVDRGLTLEEAQKHCCDEETSSSTCKGEDGLNETEKFGKWFDGYEEEK